MKNQSENKKRNKFDSYTFIHFIADLIEPLYIFCSYIHKYIYIYIYICYIYILYIYIYVIYIYILYIYIYIYSLLKLQQSAKLEERWFKRELWYATQNFMLMQSSGILCLLISGQ